MLVSDLLNQLKQRRFSVNLWPAQPQLLDVEIGGVCFDSRRVQAGDLFCAISGEKHLGADYILPAIDSGTVLVLVDRLQPQIEFPQLVVAEGSLNTIAAHCADIVYEQPSKKMYCAAITGTNGKTTIAHLMRGAFSQMGQNSASCGTLGLIDSNGIKPNINTTPSSDITQQWMASLVADDCSSVVVEASSHGIVQQRLAAIEFDCVGFSNLSHDHLDYHGTLEKYAQAKSQLILDLPENSIAFVPHDEMLLGLSASAKAKVFSWSSRDTAASYYCCISNADELLRIEFDWRGVNCVIESELCGYHNGENLFLAALMMLAKGEQPLAVCTALSQQLPADGRLQQVPVHCGRAFVDYAHTPDAIEKALNALRSSYPTAFIKAVFGAGGDRDVSKRAAMGAVVSSNADWCVLTSDNPRTESAQDIIDDVKKGVDAMSVEFHCIAERGAAINYAIQSLTPKDVLVVLGKGHENYQEINGVRHQFDDRLQIIEAVQCLA
ncbi:MAG: UDP-N-acetylmuramoyl-L-alanyl-D-glutamate--2,6-diaminopimelate ligase [Planctomycetes bacterium]|nr:UDP-N-acetylmuramoyl-L-alanyl-D-glutamate--2,6-diaminopimelate ligase [Planctomycetota bacterium]